MLCCLYSRLPAGNIARFPPPGSVGIQAFLIHAQLSSQSHPPFCSQPMNSCSRPQGWKRRFSRAFSVMVALCLRTPPPASEPVPRRSTEESTPPGKSELDNGDLFKDMKIRKFCDSKRPRAQISSGCPDRVAVYGGWCRHSWAV